MEQRISLITLGVADLARSLDFYRRLGWRRSMAQSEGVVFFQAGGMGLALYPRDELARDAKLSAEGGGFCGMTLPNKPNNKEEVEAVQYQDDAAGAKLRKPAEEAFWGGYSGYFADLDGFAWEVAWNPRFPIAADGSIRIPD